MNLAAWRRSAERVQDAVSGLCAVLAGFSLVAIAVLTVLEVAARTLASAPLGWNVALVEQYLMTSMAFFGLVTAYRAGAHIAVVTLYERFRAPVRKALHVLALVLLLGSLGWLAVAGIDTALFSFRTGEAPVPGSAELPLPTWWWKSIMPLGAVLGFVVVLIDLVRELTENPREPVTEPPVSADLSEVPANPEVHTR